MRRASAEQLESRSRLVSNLRGLAFAVLVVAFLSAAFADADAWQLRTVVGVLATLAFALLVAWHARVLDAEDLAWRFWRVNENAAQRARDEYSAFAENGAEFQEPRHPFSADLDVFGARSLFQFLNIAHTSYGQSALARCLSRLDSYSEIVARQAAVREMVPMLELRQELEAYTLRSANPPGRPQARVAAVLDLEELIRWAEGEAELLPQTALIWVARVLPLLSLAGFVGAQLAGWPPPVWVVPIGLQILLTLRVVGIANRVFAAVSSSPGAFARLRPTLRALENQRFEAPLLAELGAVLRGSGAPASEQMQRFERVLGWFELRHNGMVYPLLNVLLLWDFHCVVAFEKWRKLSGRALRPWLGALGQWEALSSLAGVAYDNPDFVFPEIVSGPAVFEAYGLGHPLIPAAQRVPNDVVLSGPGTALLVTGSNMSGKSTLLRAMGVAAVLGLAGTAVCATRLRLSALHVYTSMRISDSLAQGVSHFYAELEKLRGAIAAATAGQSVFFLLDEILHGTNSEERQVGARWVLSTLIEAGATGAVSTHDMALCTLTPELMEHVRTVHLRESVSGERMTFDFKVRPGPVRGGNALRLMRSLGLSVPLLEHAPSDEPRS
ncbi:MAG TPA: DNA mismatch repair protein MutS [Polyangiaceae bacterium]|nr:DNA mismatch repair protein MutS [Polyangiaceae bacterium]